MPYTKKVYGIFYYCDRILNILQKMGDNADDR